MHRRQVCAGLLWARVIKDRFQCPMLCQQCCDNDRDDNGDRNRTPPPSFLTEGRNSAVLWLGLRALEPEHRRQSRHLMLLCENAMTDTSKRRTICGLIFQHSLSGAAIYCSNRPRDKSTPKMASFTGTRCIIIHPAIRTHHARMT